jgi:hypothetical protein
LEAAFFGYFLCRGKESNCRPAQGQRLRREGATRMPPQSKKPNGIACAAKAPRGCHRKSKNRTATPAPRRQKPKPQPLTLYNLSFYQATEQNTNMEAERLNAIESSLADLRTRAGELRGYL